MINLVILNLSSASRHFDTKSTETKFSILAQKTNAWNRSEEVGDKPTRRAWLCVLPHGSVVGAAGSHDLGSLPLIANPDASVVKIKGCEKSGLCSRGSSHHLSFKSSNASCCFSDQLNFWSFFRSWFKGVAILENPSINLL